MKAVLYPKTDEQKNVYTSVHVIDCPSYMEAYGECCEEQERYLPGRSFHTESGKSPYQPVSNALYTILNNN